MADQQLSATTIAINGIRSQIKGVATQLKFLVDITKKGEHAKGEKEDRGEMIANGMLAYRALEDSSMRLGKMIQAHDGGVSVYDKATTVGAPDIAPSALGLQCGVCGFVVGAARVEREGFRLGGSCPSCAAGKLEIETPTAGG